MTQLWTSIIGGSTLQSEAITQGIIPLTDHVILSITGINAVTFLQGQCTCDFGQLAQQQWLLGAHCNAKGRMQSSFVAAQLAADCVLLRVHSSIAEQTLKNLQKYALFSKVKCEQSHYIGAAVIGSITAPNNALADHQFEVEGTDLWLQHNDEISEVWLPANGSLWPTLKQLPLWSANEWQRLMIEQGTAEVQAATMENYIPQEFNFDLNGGVSFKKGCYTGQEIIARVHYRGQSKKRLVRASLADVQGLKLPTIGSHLVNEHGKNIGEVIAAANTEAGFSLLACVPSSAATTEPAERLYLDGQMEQPLLRHPLPYAIP